MPQAWVQYPASMKERGERGYSLRAQPPEPTQALPLSWLHPAQWPVLLLISSQAAEAKYAVLSLYPPEQGSGNRPVERVCGKSDEVGEKQEEGQLKVGKRGTLSSKVRSGLRVRGMRLCDVNYFGVGSAGKTKGKQSTDTAPSRLHGLEVRLLFRLRLPWASFLARSSQQG